MNDNFEKALDDYEKHFNDGFPTFPMSGKSEEEIITIIYECIQKNSDVYELEYLSLSLDNIY